MASWYITEHVPHMDLLMIGDILPIPEDQSDDTKRSHFDQFFNFRIDDDTDEFVIRFKRRSDAPPGHTNVAMKIEGGLTEQPDGSVVLDGGYNENGVSKFGLSFEITHVETSEEEAEEEPEEKEIKFFHHPEHKLRLVNEYEYTNGFSDESYCRACTERIAGSRGRWVYTCPETECDYYGVHSACGLLATKIRHPSHPKHVLKLVKLDNPSYCDVCQGCINAAGLDYQCAKCNFDMHPLCPELQEEEDGPADEDGYEDASGAADEASELRLQRTQQLSEAQQLLHSHQRNTTGLMQMQMENAIVNQYAANMRMILGTCEYSCDV